MACPSGPIPPLFFCHRTASPSPTFLSPSESPAALFTALTFFFFLSPHRRTRAWWRTGVALSASSHHAHSQRGVDRWRSGREVACQWLTRMLALFILSPPPSRSASVSPPNRYPQVFVTSLLLTVSLAVPPFPPSNATHAHSHTTTTPNNNHSPWNHHHHHSITPLPVPSPTSTLPSLHPSPYLSPYPCAVVPRVSLLTPGLCRWLFH